MLHSYEKKRYIAFAGYYRAEESYSRSWTRQSGRTGTWTHDHLAESVHNFRSVVVIVQWSCWLRLSRVCVQVSGLTGLSKTLKVQSILHQPCVVLDNKKLGVLSHRFQIHSNLLQHYISRIFCKNTNNHRF